MKHLVAPQAIPQQVESRLAEKPYYVRLAQEYWGDVLTPEAIDQAWEEMAAEVRAHTPPHLHHILKGFAGRRNAR